MSSPTPPRPRGRPALSPDGAPLQQVNVRLTAEDRAKFDALGGVAWLRAALKRAKLPEAR